MVSVDIKRLIVRNCTIFPQDFVAIILDVSLSTVRRTLKTYEECGDVVNPDETKLQLGRVSILNDEDRQFIENILEQRKDMYLDELADFVFERRGKKASTSTLSRALASMGMTHKQLTKEAAERDPDKRGDYMTQIALFYRTEQLVFIDECYVDKRASVRQKGWSKKGTRAEMAVPFLRGKRFSILPALSIDGILDVRVFEGSVNTERFLSFIEGLLMEMNPYPGRNSVLVMDNVQFHHNPFVRELCEARGVRLIYLSPYSPDYNPIEEAFSSVKAWLKRNNELVRNTFEQCSSAEIASVLTLAVYEAATAEKAVGWFRDSGYELYN